MVYYLAIKNENLPLVTIWMNLEGCQTNVRKRQILHDITYMWNLREKIKHNKNKFMDREQTSGYQKGGVWGVCKIGEEEFRGTDLQL